MSLLFSRNFDDDLAMEAQQRIATETERHFCQAEMDAMIDDAARKAREEGYAEGLTAGRDEISQGIGAERLAVLKALSGPISSLMQSERQRHSVIERDLTEFMTSLCETVAPDLIENLSEIRIHEEVSSIVNRAQGSRWIEVRVTPEHRDAIESDLIGLIQNPDGNQELRVVADPSLSRGDIQAFWSGGRSKYSLSALCKKIVSLLHEKSAGQKTQN